MSDTSSTQEILSGIFLRDVSRFDCAIFDPGLGVIGQSWNVDINLLGPIDEQGFVHDFGTLKGLISQTLKASLDHALIIPIGSQGIMYAETPEGELWRFQAKSRNGGPDNTWEYRCPKGAVYPIRSVALRPAVIEQEIARLLRHRLPDSVHQITAKLREETIDATQATYRHTHGILSHAGFCQRLFHGHRNRVEVYAGAERRPDLEQWVARELLGANVHVSTPAQVKSGGHPIGTRGKPEDTITIGGTGSLGYYEAVLPADRVFMVETETSCECTGRQILKALKEREKNSREKLRVICFEGIGKGSLVEG
jgi:6-pyruvoyl-tetrahydropterin synthase